ncbi:hypothetical protein [Streptomyces sedi]|uniref:Uncharacterized protein n=1 Tax=Streptomyces sedi TaxID=555059 RepID=A0A5C4VFP4_9ACTN|nr:hypothetical protein [Streptomyces sedi]TNM34405.1 hypothetical protein FH715_01615 [Streptomyces sedi]
MLIVVLLMGALLVGGGNWITLRLWRNGRIGDLPAAEAVESTFFYLKKTGSRRAAVRILPVSLAGLEAVWCALLWNELVGDPADLLLVILFVALFGCILTAASIAFFNRPKSLVPPARRADFGILPEWSRKRSAGKLPDGPTDSSPT